MTAPTTVVLFGATGDLAKRKLIPGLLHLFQSRARRRPARRGHLPRRADPDALPRPRARRHPRAQHPRDGGRRLARVRAAPRLRAAVGRPAGPGGGRRAAPRRCCPGEVNQRLHYLSVPPEGGARRGAHHRRGRPRRAQPGRHGEAVRHRLRLGGRPQRPAARGVRRGADLPDRPLPRQGAGAEHPRLPLRQRPVRADLAPEQHLPHRDRRARDPRPHPARRLLRGAPAPTATWSSRTCSRSSRSRRWSRRPRSSRPRSAARRTRSSARCSRSSPPTSCAGSTPATTTSPASAPTPRPRPSSR